jgi:hypothetical protein
MGNIKKVVQKTLGTTERSFKVPFYIIRLFIAGSVPDVFAECSAIT